MHRKIYVLKNPHVRVEEAPLKITNSRCPPQSHMGENVMIVTELSFKAAALVK